MEFKGPYTCPVCDELFETTLDLATHNEETNHLNQNPALKRVSHHKIPHQIEVKVRRIVRVDLGSGFYFEKEVYA